MKVILTADWHIGVRGDSELYHNIFKKWIVDFFVPIINSEGVETVCILGDFYDNRSAVNTTSDNLGIWAIKYILSETKVNIYMVVGNHDIYFKNTRETTSLKKFEEYDRVFVINEIYKSRFGSREIVFVPWVINEDVYSIKGDICLGHFPFNGFEMVRGVKETRGYSLDKIKNNFLKVYSGHFHLRNDIYIGNPFQMSWNDTEDEKGVGILDTETLNVKFISNNISPIYKKVYLSQLKNKSISLDIISGNFIKIFLDDKYSDIMISKLEEVVKLKKPLSFTFEGLNGEEDVENNIEVKDLTNPIESLILWLNRIELRKNIDRSILLEKMNNLYKDF